MVVELGENVCGAWEESHFAWSLRGDTRLIDRPAHR